MDRAPTESLPAAANPAGVVLPADQTAALRHTFLAQWMIPVIVLLLLGGFIANTCVTSGRIQGYSAD